MSMAEETACYRFCLTDVRYSRASDKNSDLLSVEGSH